MSSTLPTLASTWVLASRPQGEPVPENFRLDSTDLPELAEGQILVHNSAISVDPYMRGRMDDKKSYVPPFAIDAPLDGGAVGTVVASKSPDFSEGQTVTHQLGWRDYAVVDAQSAQAVDTDLAPASAYLGVLGMPGVTAYAGLMKVAQFAEGDVVFVSGAAGAVGSLVGQIAKAKGAKAVIGSAGSAEKVEHLKKIGFDAAFNYHDAGSKGVAGMLGDALAGLGLEGIDVYFDNVGGDQLEAAIAKSNKYARIAMCGAIGQYNLEPGQTPQGPRNLALAIGKEIMLKGFIVRSYWEYAQEAAEFIAPLLSAGKLDFSETVRHGLDDAAQAFIDLLRGANTGKMVVKVG